MTPMTATRVDLARDLVRASYLKGDFVLSSGRRSDRYFDKYLFETEPQLLKALGESLADLIPNETQRLAAPEMGAILLGGAVSLVTNLPLILVRKEPKGHGTAQQLEGKFRSGELVTVIEDVVTTGAQALHSIEVLQQARLKVIRLVAVLDRSEGGEETFRRAAIPYSPLFRLTDLDLG
jgi:orotate phosphoribosyltransferase